MEDKHSDFDPLLSCLHELGSLLPAWDTLEPAPATSTCRNPASPGSIILLNTHWLAVKWDAKHCADTVVSNEKKKDTLAFN